MRTHFADNAYKLLSELKTQNTYWDVCVHMQCCVGNLTHTHTHTHTHIHTHTHLKALMSVLTSMKPVASESMSLSDA